MNGKKIVSTLVVCVMVLITTLVILPAVANADVDVSNASIARIGIDPRFQGPMVQLIDNGTTKKWTGVRQFYLSSTLGNQGLAAMLTSYSMGKTLWVRIAGDGSAGSLITIMFIND